MQIDQLSIRNYCCFESFEISLNPNFNLLVGDNASGKTSILDAIHIAAGSWLLGVRGPGKSPSISEGYVRLIPLEYAGGKVTFEKKWPVTIKATGTVMGESLVWSREKTSDHSTTHYSEAISIRDVGRRAVDLLPVDRDMVLPLISFYGTERLWIEPTEERKERRSKRKKPPSRLDGYDDIHFTIHDEKLFDWIAKQTIAGLQTGTYSPAFKMVKNAILGCIDDAKDLYYDVDREEVVVILTTHGTHPFRDLSDGQRVMLTLVADIAKKACLLNPNLDEEVLRQTPGVVTIDELDLHLHPKWQRRVIQDLKRTFPRIQFIATTHSPQLIGEALPWETIRLGADEVQASSPTQSYGMDSNWILKYVMDANERDQSVQERIARADRLICDLHFAEAREELNSIRNDIRGNHPELVRLSARIDRIAGTNK